MVDIFLGIIVKIANFTRIFGKVRFGAALDIDTFGSCRLQGVTAHTQNLSHLITI